MGQFAAAETKAFGEWVTAWKELPSAFPSGGDVNSKRLWNPYPAPSTLQCSARRLSLF